MCIDIQSMNCLDSYVHQYDNSFHPLHMYSMLESSIHLFKDNVWRKKKHKTFTKTNQTINQICELNYLCWAKDFANVQKFKFKADKPSGLHNIYRKFRQSGNIVLDHHIVIHSSSYDGIVLGIQYRHIQFELVFRHVDCIGKPLGNVAYHHSEYPLQL